MLGRGLQEWVLETYSLFFSHCNVAIPIHIPILNATRFILIPIEFSNKLPVPSHRNSRIVIRTTALIIWTAHYAAPTFNSKHTVYCSALRKESRDEQVR